jgi:hypothetical protein
VLNCADLGITLGGDNVVAVVPLECVTGATGKDGSYCSVVPDAAAATMGLDPGRERAEQRHPDHGDADRQRQRQLRAHRHRADRDQLSEVRCAHRLRRQRAAPTTRK